MRFFPTYIILLLEFMFSTLAIAGKARRGNFTIRAHPNPNYKPHGTAALLKTFRKRTNSVPCALEKLVLRKRLGNLYRAFRDLNQYQNPLRKRESSIDVASPIGEDVQYLCPVQVGDTTLNLEFDTGSADLWVFSSELDSDERKGHRYYAPGSTAQQQNGSTWSVGYGDGSSAQGNVYNDTVTIGQVVVQNQAVELAQNVSESFSGDASSDGLLGLAFSDLNSVEPNYVNTFFDNAKSNLDMDLFAVDLRHLQPGSYSFGAIDSTKYQGVIRYAALDRSRGYWGFAASKGFKVGGKKYSAVAPQGAIADTGTTLLLMSPTVVQTYYKQVKGAIDSPSEGGWIFPCSAKLPSLSIPVGNYLVPIQTQFLNYHSVSATYCFGGLQSLMGADSTPWIYGDIVFKSLYVIFDDQNSRVGFAVKSSY